MKMIMLFLFVSLPLYSQVELHKDVLEAVKMLEVSEGNIPGVMNLNYSLEAQDPNCKEMPLVSENKNSKLLIAKKDELGPWKVSIKSTLISPKSKFNKEVLTADSSSKLKNTLDHLIKTDYANYGDRMKAVKSACNGMTDFEKISMGSLLAGRLSNIYDYNRANGGSDAIIKPEQQWAALKSNTPSGVCRDDSITVSQFLLACGFRKEQIAIKSYSTENSGHQITSIRTKDGEYSINWDELYNVDSKQFLSPEPNLVNTGLFYRLYDPETGKILETKRTELADAMKILAGGNTKDPYYTPNMIVAEAAYGGFAAKVFENADSMGNSAKGAAASYNSAKGNEREFTVISTGVVYARNERDVLDGKDINKLKQDIVYVQYEVKQQKNIPLFDTKSGKLSIAPSWGGSADASVAFNDYKGNKSKTMEVYSEFSGGATVFYNSDPIKAHIGAEATTVFSTRMFNSEQDKSGIGFYVTRYYFDAGASWENNRLYAAANSNVIISKTEKQYSAGVTLKDKKLNVSCQAVYSVYNRNYGSRDDYIVSRCSKEVSIERIGRVSFDANTRIGLNNTKDTTLMLGATFKFK